MIDTNSLFYKYKQLGWDWNLELLDFSAYVLTKQVEVVGWVGIFIAVGTSVRIGLRCCTKNVASLLRPTK